MGKTINILGSKGKLVQRGSLISTVEIEASDQSVADKASNFCELRLLNKPAQGSIGNTGGSWIAQLFDKDGNEKGKILGAFQGASGPISPTIRLSSEAGSAVDLSTGTPGLIIWRLDEAIFSKGLVVFQSQGHVDTVGMFCNVDGNQAWATVEEHFGRQIYSLPFTTVEV